jgi:hypothetical protein
MVRRTCNIHQDVFDMIQGSRFEEEFHMLWKELFAGPEILGVVVNMETPQGLMGSLPLPPIHDAKPALAIKLSIQLTKLLHVTNLDFSCIIHLPISTIVIRRLRSNRHRPPQQRRARNHAPSPRTPSSKTHPSLPPIHHHSKRPQGRQLSNHAEYLRRPRRVGIAAVRHATARRRPARQGQLHLAAHALGFAVIAHGQLIGAIVVELVGARAGEGDANGSFVDALEVDVELEG